jgi:hypothetical protein
VTRPLPAPAAAAFRSQAASCRALGSPFTARLLDLCAGALDLDSPVGARIADWPGDLGPSGASVPLRLAGTLNHMRLAGEGRLAAVWPPHDADDAALWNAVDAILRDRPADVLAGLDSAPQTNEVRRSAALILAAHWLAQRTGLPLVLSELGASAGLNLMFDRFALATPDGPRGAETAALDLAPDWRGGPAPPFAVPAPTPFRVIERRGVDLSPVDPADPVGRRRLLAYIWPDQPHRLALTEAALAIARAPVDRADAVDWLATRLTPRPGALHLVYHTIAWQYFPAEAQARGAALLAAAGRAATPDAPLAHLAVEADGRDPGAGIALHLWDGHTADGVSVPLGRMDYHGRWIDWQAPPP